MAPADGENKLKALLQESLAVATRTDAMKPSDLARVVIDAEIKLSFTLLTSIWVGISLRPITRASGVRVAEANKNNRAA